MTEKSNSLSSLQVILKKSADGKNLGWEQSLEALSQNLATDLQDLADGRFNGTPLKPTQNKAEPMQIALQPVLAAAAAVANAAAINSGYGTIEIPYGSDRDLFSGNATKKTTSIDIVAAEKQLVAMINTWLSEAKKDPSIGLPLAVNSPARAVDGQITKLTDVLVLMGKYTEYKPLGPLTNTQAAQPLAMINARFASGR